MACIKLKKLEEYLQCLDDFESPNIKLEQYITPYHLASTVLFTIQSNYGDIENKLVADLGSGCGMLSVGSAILGSAHVVGFEIDEKAIEVCPYFLFLNFYQLIYHCRLLETTAKKWKYLLTLSNATF